jgi:nitrile hydratase
MSYQSHADLGGRRGYGAVVPEPEGELWHAPWEPKALALTLAMGATGAWNIDMSRAARETLPDYERLSYYQIWALALEKLLEQRALVSAEERAAGRAITPALPLARRLVAADVPSALARGSPTERPNASGVAGVAGSAAKFAPGDTVRLRAEAVNHHTRLPGYARGRLGRIEACRGRHVFADAHSLGLGEQPQWLYTVVFDGRELWGDEPEAARLAVSIDAWEPYLQATQGAR